MAVVTVTNVEKDAAGAMHTNQITASKPADKVQLRVIIPWMLAVAAAVVGMWFAYKDGIKPTTIGIAKSYVPYAAVIAVAAALERLLEPLSDYLVPSITTAKTTAAESTKTAQGAAANPELKTPAVQTNVDKAAADQAEVETLTTTRAVVFWAIASILGVGISGSFGLFLLQSIATGHVNSFLDLAVTGLTIGAGTKPTHDLIASLQAKASSSSSS
jgi:hypothetical protein